VIDEEGALLDFDCREVLAAQAPSKRPGPRRTYQPDPDVCPRRSLPAGLANICHTGGIEVIEAMPKPAADIDEPGAEIPPSTVTRLR
jgi:DeoR family glycerol-3-phosphate regulon repressor